MYQYESRIRYSELNSEGKLSLEALLNYFQDCSTFHSEDLGVGVEYLTRRGLAWVLSAWQIVVERYPGLCERVIIKTAPYDFKGFLGYRNFVLETEKGERLAYANTIWTLMDMKNRKPVRITGEMQEAYVLEEKIEMDYAPRKIGIPDGEGVEQAAVEVKKHHLDTNNHVNNGQYISIAMEYVPADFVIGQMRAEYKQQALLGDIILPKVYREGDTCTVVLNREEKQPYCIVELKRMKREGNDG